MTVSLTTVRQYCYKYFRVCHCPSKKEEKAKPGRNNKGKQRKNQPEKGETQRIQGGRQINQTNSMSVVDCNEVIYSPEEEVKNKVNID